MILKESMEYTNSTTILEEFIMTTAKTGTTPSMEIQYNPINKTPSKLTEGLISYNKNQK